MAWSCSTGLGDMLSVVMGCLFSCFSCIYQYTDCTAPMYGYRRKGRYKLPERREMGSMGCEIDVAVPLWLTAKNSM
ncbi:hypothetical protein QBC39DRAFT_364680 [Podospora conica]|nr:hypothetical protein QBC39DRAFT_364680 [Schizothecium conicum]